MQNDCVKRVVKHEQSFTKQRSVLGNHSQLSHFALLHLLSSASTHSRMHAFISSSHSRSKNSLTNNGIRAHKELARHCYFILWPSVITYIISCRQVMCLASIAVILPTCFFCVYSLSPLFVSILFVVRLSQMKSCSLFTHNLYAHYRQKYRYDILCIFACAFQQKRHIALHTTYIPHTKKYYFYYFLGEIMWNINSKVTTTTV